MKMRACFGIRIAAVAAGTLFPLLPAACLESLQAGDYTVIVDGRGKLVIKRNRVAIVTTSYAGMFGRLPSGAAIYWINAGQHLEVKRVGKDSGRPRLVLRNTGDRGVTMQREAIFEKGGIRLLHEIAVPAGVVGAIDTGFTLNPVLACDAAVSVRADADGEFSATKLGVGDDCLPYRSSFQKIVFDGEWGALSVDFDTAEGLQSRGALLNFARSTSRPSATVQVLPLFTGVSEGKPAATYRSSCFISFEPTPGKRYMSPRRNLLYNAGFEDWSNPDLPDGWRRTPEATRETSAGMAPDETVTFNGQRSLRWGLDGGALSHVTQRRDYLSPGVVEGPCAFSAYMRSEPAGVRVTLTCGRWREAVETSGEWQRFSVIAEKGSGGRAFPIRIEKLSQGILWIDAVQLEEADEPTSFVARDRATVFGNPMFPADLLADDIAELVQALPALRGCGPELSYYTSEGSGRLIYDLDLSPVRRTTATLMVQLTDPGGAPVMKKTFAAPLDCRVMLEFNATQLPVGISHAVATLTAGNEILGNLTHDVVKLSPLRRGVEVKINRLTRTLVRGGDPYIPVGSDAASSVERALECIRGQAANEFNHIHIWSGFAKFVKTPNGRVPELRPDDLLQMLDTAHDAGMTVTVNLSHWLSINHFHQERFQNKDLTDEQIFERALQAVRVAREHPALLTWHLLDEPNPAYCTPEWTQRIYDAVRSEDPYHPAEINVCGTGRNMLAYTGGSDLMSIDIYPVPTSHIGVIAPHTRFMWLADDWRPVRWWIQSFANLREPTATEESCMTYQAIVEGMRFLLFYNYRPTSWAAWSGLGRIAREVRDLRPALITERADVAVATAGGESRVIASLHRTGDQVWVIAVNCDTEPVEAKLTLPLDCVDATAEVMFEGRRVTCDRRILKDLFEPMARHVYRIDP